MDANKLEKLSEIGYTLQPSCGLCAHSFFSNANSDWGVCVKFFYKHKKHTGEPRQLSIHRSGCCPNFLISEQKEKDIAHYEQFLKE